ncbi:hypothetical protein [Rhizobium leguminosarum]|uniref:hypothetical protein n=1 Tax=Rhizobium leguminosarum TaxID=384 RepID=UPI0024B39D9A|nr:hypothetical protein [Rhizobium leguminosarum]WHO84102.1 hypothetical protein QMO81_007045 [Rhizobium leguminosarum]
MEHSHLKRYGRSDIVIIEQKRPEAFNARLEVAIKAIELSWSMLSEAARDFDTDIEKPVLEDASRRGYFETMKWEALELADAIYWSASDATRRQDDRDLEKSNPQVLPKANSLPVSAPLGCLRSRKTWLRRTSLSRTVATWGSIVTRQMQIRCCQAPNVYVGYCR